MMREVHYPEWLANSMVVRTENGKTMVCIYFIDLNKSCLKDNFPLLYINRMVDATTRHALLSLLDFFGDTIKF